MRIISFASGSKGNCTLVSDFDMHFLVDCGISMRRIKACLSNQGLSPSDLSGIFVTHEHSDHICGLKIISKYYNIPIYAPHCVAKHLRYSIAGVESCLREITAEENIAIGPCTVRAFHTSHDTEESVGYRFEGSCSFAIATDSGTVTEGMISGLTGANVVIIEANHDVDMLLSGSYPYPLKRRILSDFGHLSNADCGKLAAHLADTGTRYIVLGHLSQENNTPARAFGCVNAALAGRDVMLLVAPEAENLSIEPEVERL